MALRGIMDSTDVPNAGATAAARLTGLNAQSPLVSTRPGRGPGLRNDVDVKYSRISTSRAADTDGIPADLPGAHVQHSWATAFNPNSPAFWILMFILGIVGFAHLQVKVGGKRGIGASLG